MLSNQVKRYLEETVKQRYQEIDPKDSNCLQLRKKIGYLDKLLSIGIQKEAYQAEIQTMVAELERVVIQEGMVSFSAVANLNLILALMLELQNKESINSIEVFRTLKIISNPEILQNIFPQEESGTLEQMQKAEEYLQRINRKDLIPYTKAWYLSSNPPATNQMPIYIYWNYVSYLFLAYIELAYKVRELIMEQYCQEKIKVTAYLQDIIKRYGEKVNFQYIPSSVVPLEGMLSTQEDTEIEAYIPFIDINQDDALKKVKLIGYAGAGKTTTLEYIAYQDALSYKENGKIPVILSLITIEQKEKIENLLRKKFQLAEDETEVISYLLEKNKLQIYFDGINEISISDPFEKRAFLQELEEFIIAKENANIKMIVTDRDNDEVSILNHYPTFLIQGMTEQDVNAFIEGNASPDKVEKVKQVLAENPELMEEMTHPIQLKNFITIIECNKPIPADPEELAESYLNAIIDREITEKKEKLAPYIHDALVYLVQKITQKPDWTANCPTSYFKIMEIFQEFAQKKQVDVDAETFLNLLQKMGILKEVEFEKYAFSDEKFFHIYYYEAITEE